MKFSRLVFVWVLLVQSFFSLANSLEIPLSCSLPAPSWLTATSITSSSITIEWADVSGANSYRVTRYDVTNGINLPDVDVTEPEYTSEPHDPGTAISFEVFPMCENGELGSPIGGEYTTNIIIVDDIVNFSIPNPPLGNAPIPPNTDSPAFGFSDATYYNSMVDVLRLKLTYTDPHNNPHTAEVLMWSHCASPFNAAPRVMYWDESNWAGGVTYTENHYNNEPNGPIVSITFTFEGGQPFFTIYKSQMLFLPNGPILGSLTIHNDRPLSQMDNRIFFARSFNNERNPCYVPRMQGKGGGGDKPVDNASSERSGSEDGVKTTSNLQVSPNPFADNLQADYDLEVETSVKFTLFDHTGREINTLQLPILPPGHYSTIISTDNLPTGIYLLSMQTAQGRTMTTLIKH